jgi:hypothetical protein
MRNSHWRLDDVAMNTVNAVECETVFRVTLSLTTGRDAFLGSCRRTTLYTLGSTVWPLWLYPKPGAMAADAGR